MVVVIVLLGTRSKNQKRLDQKKKKEREKRNERKRERKKGREKKRSVAITRTPTCTPFVSVRSFVGGIKRYSDVTLRDINFRTGLHPPFAKSPFLETKQGKKSDFS